MSDLFNEHNANEREIAAGLLMWFVESQKKKTVIKAPLAIQKTDASISKPSYPLMLKFKMKKLQVEQMEDITPPLVFNDQKAISHDPIVIDLCDFQPPMSFDEYCQCIWNKDFWVIADSSAYQAKARDLVKNKIKNLCFASPSIFIDRMMNFFEAGLKHRDFVQIKIRPIGNSVTRGAARDVLKAFGQNCRFCVDKPCTNLVNFTHVHHSSSAATNNKNISFSATTCSGCHDEFMKVVYIFHHFWSVSYPLKGYSYQGFQCLPLLPLKVGSSDIEDKKEAYDHLMSLFEKLE